MKKIHSHHSNKDRIVCESTNSGLIFYYQPTCTRNRYWLFNSRARGGSILNYFRERGIKLDRNCYSLTIGELYRFDKYYNPRLSKLIARIPAQVDYVIREFVQEELDMAKTSEITIYNDMYQDNYICKYAA